MPPNQTIQCCDLSFSIAMCGIFWVYIGRTDSTQCQGPVWFWSNFAKFYFTTDVGLRLLLTCCLVCCGIGEMVFLLVVVIKLVMVPLFVGVIIAEMNIEECSDLEIPIHILLVAMTSGQAAILCFCFNQCIGTSERDFEEPFNPKVLLKVPPICGRDEEAEFSP